MIETGPEASAAVVDPDAPFGSGVHLWGLLIAFLAVRMVFTHLLPPLSATLVDFFPMGLLGVIGLDLLRRTDRCPPLLALAEESHRLTFGLCFALIGTIGLAPPVYFVAFNPAITSIEEARFLYLVIMVPLVEEVYFRGLVLTWFRGRTDLPTAVLFSAILFAGLHATTGLGAAVLTSILLGTLCAAATVLSQSLIPAVLLHATWNFVALLPYSSFSDLIGRTVSLLAFTCILYTVGRLRAGS